MSEKISLKEVEQQVFVSSYQDGLMDILIGSVVLMFAVGPYITPYLGDFWGSVVFLPFWVIVFAIVWLVRKNVVKPRVGSFKVGSWRQKRMLRFSLTMVVVFILSALLGVLSAVKYEAVPGWMHTARFSLIILLSFCAIAYFIKLHRLYLYGILIAAAPMVGELLWRYLDVPHHGYPVTFGLTTLIIVGTGLTLLARLISEHPIEEINDPGEANK